MRPELLWLLIVSLFSLIGCQSDDDSPSPSEEPVEKLATVRWENSCRFYRGEIVNIADDGTVQLENEFTSDRFKLEQQTYLAFIAPGDLWTRTESFDVFVTTVDVTNRDQKQITVKLHSDAKVRLEQGQRLIILESAGDTSEARSSLNGIVKLSFEDMTADEFLVHRDHTIVRNRLRQIGIAMHNFHDEFGHLPPAAIYGPDGRPWHSWRVLLLPYLEQAPLYDAYRFDEPWDGPNNSKLHDRIPEVFTIPGASDSFANIMVAKTSREHRQQFFGRSGFPSEGLRIPGEGDAKRSILSAIRQGNGCLGFRWFTDGTSNSFMAGYANPKTPVHWMEPVDVELGESALPLGAPDYFAAGFGRKDMRFGWFLLADGSVKQVRQHVSPADFRRFVYVDDNSTGQLTDAVTLSLEQRKRGTHFEVQLVQSGDQLKAVMRETVSEPEPKALPEEVFAESRVAGKVTINGKPVDVGHLHLFDDKGELQGTASIHNGVIEEFKTPSDKALSPGGYAVVISSGEVPARYTDHRTTEIKIEFREVPGDPGVAAPMFLELDLEG